MLDPVDVISVVGACGPERHRYATALARSMGRMLLPADRLAAAVDPVREVVALAPWAGPDAAVVAELPSAVVPTHLIGGLTEVDSDVRMSALICVVDASHLIADLRSEAYMRTDRGAGERDVFTARAAVIVAQIEYASIVVLVNWSGVSTPELAAVMALVSQLSPRARVRLQRDEGDEVITPEAYGEAQDRPGWIHMLNGREPGHMSDPRVQAFRYENGRPFHPERLKYLLDRRIEDGEFGTLVRSAGFCRFVTRPGIVAHWEHVGQMIWFTPLAADATMSEDEELLCLGQDLAFIGIDLDVLALTAALDEAVLTDAEFTAGPATWSAFADPFPLWTLTPDSAE